MIVRAKSRDARERAVGRREHLLVLDRVRSRLSGQRGFTLIELTMVVLLASMISVAVLLMLQGTSNVFNSQEVRMLNQDDARTAINQVARYLRMATDSADNQSTVSNAIALANPQEVVFYCDVDGDKVSEKVRYYLANSILRSQTEDPEWVTSPTPGWHYGSYDTDGVVIENRVRNASDPMFTYYRYNGSGALETFSPSTDSLREKIVAIGITIKVGERPDLAAKDVELTTQVQIRQRYEGGLK
jgi:prepilin-type N-terminal cleavage/methylation domain-containing protein